jgi:hypothetical protein
MGLCVVEWLKVLQVAWPIAATITPLILLAGFLWLQTKFALRKEVKDLESKVDDHAERLKIVELECSQAPSRQNLQVELSNLAQRLRGVEVSSEAVNRQLGTTNTYLHTLVERGLSKA